MKKIASSIIILFILFGINLAAFADDLDFNQQDYDKAAYPSMYEFATKQNISGFSIGSSKDAIISKLGTPDCDDGEYISYFNHTEFPITMFKIQENRVKNIGCAYLKSHKEPKIECIQKILGEGNLSGLFLWKDLTYTDRGKTVSFFWSNVPFQKGFLGMVVGNLSFEDKLPGYTAYLKAISMYTSRSNQ